MELPLNQNLKRKILHVDMDAFYAQAEALKKPEYKHKALVIGHDPRLHHNRGIVSTANYNARKYGVRSAMSSFEALRLVPKNELVFKEPDFELYRNLSNQIHKIFESVTDKIEYIALDEAYLDVTENFLSEKSAVKIATQIQTTIYNEVGIYCSVGISHNKFLAKLASDYNKPRGRTVILPETAQNFIDKVPIGAFHGIGQKTLPKLTELGINNGADLRNFGLEELVNKFGKAGYYMYLHAHGVDNRSVKRRDHAKSISKERTVEYRINSKYQIERGLQDLGKQVLSKAVEKDYLFKTIFIKLKDTDFKVYSKQRKVSIGNYSQQLFDQTVSELLVDLLDTIDEGHEFRLIGVGVSDLSVKKSQNLELDLF